MKGEVVCEDTNNGKRTQTTAENIDYQSFVRTQTTAVVVCEDTNNGKNVPQAISLR